jgi:pimeloyl-ACP methyl ester carboxylesterase
VPVALVAGATLFMGAVKANGAEPTSTSQDPGTLISDSPLHAPGVDGTAYLVDYWSKSQQDEAVEVTGLVFVPTGSAPAGGWPVVSYGHPTDGMAPSCAPSLDPSTDVPDINGMLKRGWEVVATDYQGENNQTIAPKTSGLQPHGVNLPTARNIIDIVRAATELPAAHASTDYVVWGYSQGATAATFVSDIAASYAPELTLEGVVATAPATGLTEDFYGAPTAAVSPFTLMYVAGYNSTYGNDVVPLSMTPLGMSFYNDLGHDCYSELAQAMSSYQVGQVFTTTTLTFPFAILLSLNDPLFVEQAPSAPVLFVQGMADTTNTALYTWMEGAHMCSLGQDTQLWEYPGLGHEDIVGSSMGDVEHWIADRFAGVSNPDPFMPDGVAGVQRSTCN